MHHFKIPSVVSFPESVSSTAIELLMHQTYKFYAQKMLKLRMLDRFKTGPNLADFGIFVHYILDHYTKSYLPRSHKEQSIHFLSIASAAFEKMNFRIQDSWMYKINAVAEEFVDFDESRRAKASKIWSEQKGSATLDVLNTKIRLTSIADRIELSLTGETYILDYKTGVIPSKQDVEYGLAPQMLISGIIAYLGGFECLSSPVVPARIVYVKLASCSPYWRVSDTILNVNKLQTHLKHLVGLLELFVKGGSELSATSDHCDIYDEYAHLSRAPAFKHY
jgi:ATP-dependent helicase/nuclease subunit B